MGLDSWSLVITDIFDFSETFTGCLLNALRTQVNWELIISEVLKLLMLRDKDMRRGWGEQESVANWDGSNWDLN